MLSPIPSEVLLHLACLVALFTVGCGFDGGESDETNAPVGGCVGVADQTVRWIVPLSAGGGYDIYAPFGALLEMHDVLYTRHEEWTKPRDPGDFLHAYASQLGLDTGAFETCYEEDHGKDRTRRATRAAEGLDVSGTPTFFINGSRALGALTIEVFRALLEEAERGATSGR